MKKIGKALFVMCLLLTPIMMVAAANYTTTFYKSSLSLGYGAIHSGATRTYDSGYNFIGIYPYGYYDEDNRLTFDDGTRLQTNYIEECDTYSRLIGTSVNTVMSTHFTIGWGYLATGNRFYGFATKIDGVDHPGLIANAVYMYVNTENTAVY